MTFKDGKTIDTLAEEMKQITGDVTCLGIFQLIFEKNPSN